MNPAKDTPAPLCFTDCETTALHPGRRAWEVALIRRESDGTERETVFQIADVDLSDADPTSLRIGRFYERHLVYNGTRPEERHRAYNDNALMAENDAAWRIEEWTRGAHIVSATGFDPQTYDPMLRRHGLIPSWHYHVLEVESMALGYLNALALTVPDRGDAKHLSMVATPPYKSDDLSEALGVPQVPAGERHTALGDARWVRDMFDAMTGGPA